LLTGFLMWDRMQPSEHSEQENFLLRNESERKTMLSYDTLN